MSSSIDNRVVSMQFDNKNFESNVKTSLSTLDKLKQSLKLDGAAKSLEGLSSSAKKVDMSPIGRAAETVGLKFNAMYTMADQALRNITNSAMLAGKRIVSALTIDPVKTGFSEYETQINAVQTILANTEHKGTTLDQVNAALDELNTYADKTIYNFTEMTKNIGTFTAAGVDLDKSVTSIKGIANLAAVSGSTSQQASTAMYQLSQALASGTVKLMDWNSVVNAGMGGQVFQNALKRTAKQMGYNVDEMIEKYGSFRESLTQGNWLTSEVLTETLTQLSGAYTEADLIAQGYTEEQAKEITKLAKTAVDAATKVKTFTQLWDTLKEAAQSGWTQSWEYIIGDFGEAKELWTSISDVVGDMINKTSESRNSLLEGALTSNWDKMIKKINEAGVETQTFEDKVKAIAKDKGQDVDALIEKYGSLENAFKKGKISADILKEAIAKIGKSEVDLSGIDKTLKKGNKGENVKKVQTALEHLGYNLGKAGADGKFGKMTQEAVKAFQELKGLEVTGIVDEKTLDALKEATTKSYELGGAVGELIDGITDLGGRELLIESLGNVFKSLMKVLKPIGVAFRDVFPPMTSEKLFGMIEGFHKLTEKMKPSMATIRKIHATFKGLFSVVKIGTDIIGSFAKGLWTLVSNNIGGLIDGFLDAGSAIGKWLTNLSDSISKTDIFGKAIDNIVSFIQNGIDAIKSFASALSLRFESPSFEWLLGVMQGIWNITTKVIGKIGEMAAGLGKAIAGIFSGGGFNTGMDLLNSGLFAGILIGIKKFIDGLSETLESSGGVTGLFEGVSESLDALKGTLEAYQTDLKSGALMKIAIAIGILAASLLVLSTIDPGKLASSLGAVAVLLTGLVMSLSKLAAISGSFIGFGKLAIAMIGISAAVLILSSALKSLSSLEWGEIGRGLAGVAGLAIVVVAAAKAMSMGGGEVAKGAIQMVIMAAAIKILASACKDLSSLSWEKLGKGLVGVGALMLAVSVFLNNTKFSAKSIVTATGIVVLAAAMKILASVCDDFGGMDWSEIGKGLVGIGGLLAEFALFTNLTGNAKNVISTGIALILIANSMKVFASVCKDFSSMSWDGLIRGLTGMTGALLAVSLAMNSLPKNTFGIGVGLVVVSAALLILANALKQMSGMSWEEVGRGLAALGGSMLILAIGLHAMNGTLSGVGALILAAGALALLTPVLTTLGSMNLASIGKALLTIAGTFLVLGVAGVLLGPLVPAILGLAGALVLLGVGILAIGGGLALLATGITALAVAGAAGAASIVASLTAIIVGIADLIPTLATKFAEAVVAFCRAIADSAGAIGSAFKDILLMLIDVITECVPAIADGALALIVGLLDALAEHAPQIVESLFQFIIGVIDSLATKTPELIKSITNLIGQVLAGVIDALTGLDASVILKAVAGFAAMALIMGALNLISPLVPGALTGAAGLAAVVAEIGAIIAAFGALAQIPGLDWLIGEGGTFLQSIGSAIGSFVGGLAGGIAEGFTDSLPNIGTNLSDFMTNIEPFITAASSIDSAALTGIDTLTNIILKLTAADILESVTSWATGGSSLTSFGTELSTFADSITTLADKLSGIDEGSVSKLDTIATVVDKFATVADKIPESGGFAQKLTGAKDLSTFASGLGDLGTNISTFVSSISEMSETDISKMSTVATAIQPIVDVANAIPAEGGLVDKIAGAQDLSSFASGVGDLGAGIATFATSIASVTEVDASKITLVAEAIQPIVDVANAIPAEGGLADKIVGAQDLSSFASGVSDLGSAVATFVSSVTNISEDDATKMATLTTVVGSIVTMANSLPEEGGFAQKITGAQDLSTFAGHLTTLGSSIATMSESLTDVTLDDVTKIGIIGSAVSALVTAAAGLKDYEGGTMFNTNLPEFAGQLKTFGEKMAEFAGTVEEVDFTKVGILVSQANRFITLASSIMAAGEVGTTLTSFGDSMIELSSDISTFNTNLADLDNTAVEASGRFVNKLTSIETGDLSGLSKLGDELKTLAEGSIKKFVSAFDGKQNTFKQTGKKIVKAIVKGMDEETRALQKEASALAIDAKDTIENKDEDFKEAGKQLAQGLADGIEAGQSTVIAAAVALAAAAIGAAKDELGIASPSKEFFALGKFSGMGYVNALVKYRSKVYDASSDMASYAKRGFTNAIAKVSDLISNGIDDQITIRPVMDLSEVYAGVDTVNGMLGFGSSVGMRANVSAISSMMSRRNQNGSNGDIVSAIKDLGKHIDDNPRTVNNINGISYDDSSNINEAVRTLIRAAKVERRM